MCGIMGYVGYRPVVNVLVRGLKRVEYRGYDSAGVAFFSNDHSIQVYKSEGKIGNIEKLLEESPEFQQKLTVHAGEIQSGIGHTRWATHGKPNETNAHPHLSQNGKIAVVHNGII